MMARSTTRSNQRPDTLMQDRICQVDETSCNARPDHTLGQTEKKLSASICLPRCPQTRTLPDAVGMSQTCQFRTHAPQQRAILFDHNACATKSPRSRASPCTIWCSVLLNGDDHPVAARRPASPKEKQGAGEHAARRRRTPHGPYLGVGVWLKSCSSATHVKFAALLGLPLPVYFATLGKTQSGRVI
jgi:hypothetical protein